MSEEQLYQYQYKTEKFSGPLEKLLELVEARQMDIAQVSLAAVTEDFFRYLEKIREAIQESETVNPERQNLMRLLADFLVVASRLILLKSKSLLPNLELTEEEEESLTELEDRLKMYRSLRPALKLLQKTWAEGPNSYGRPYFLNVPAFLEAQIRQGGEKLFFPGQHFTLENVLLAVGKLVNEAEALAQEELLVAEKIITLEEAMRNIADRIRTIGQTTLAELSADRPRREIIVVFLALLHLAHDRTVILNQEDSFSEIRIKVSPPAVNDSEEAEVVGLEAGGAEDI